jgi:Protein of unknown function (DUF2948)
MAEKLRLKAGDAEDLGVIAACLQDARVSVREMVFSPDERRFAAAFIRYRRERMQDWTSCDGLTECLAAVVFDGIDEVKYRGIDTAMPDQELVLLTIATGPGRGHLIHVDLVFEGDAQIQLRTDRIACRLDDFGAPEPCRVTPCDHLGEGWITAAPA